MKEISLKKSRSYYFLPSDSSQSNYTQVAQDHAMSLNSSNQEKKAELHCGKHCARHFVYKNYCL